MAGGVVAGGAVEGGVVDGAAEEVSAVNNQAKSAGPQLITPETLQPRKTLFALLDEWVFGLPPQLIRDWTLAFCAVVVAMQLLPDDLGAREISLRGSGAVNRDASADSWNLMPCLLYTSPSPRDKRQSRMPSSA